MLYCKNLEVDGIQVGNCNLVTLRKENVELGMDVIQVHNVQKELLWQYLMYMPWCDGAVCCDDHLM